MNKDLKNGLLVAGGAILLYLLYKKATKKSDVAQKETMPPIEVELPIDRPRPIEAVMIDAPINL